MIGCVGGSRDRSCLCLIAIYAAHVALFHVFDVAPLVAGGGAVSGSAASSAAMSPMFNPNANHISALHQHQLQRQVTSSSSIKYNDTGSGGGAGRGDNPQLEAGGAAVAADIRDGKLRPAQVFTKSSAFQWDNPTNHPMASHPKFHLDFLFSLSFCHQVRNVFATIALSSSTWGIICGCAIFLLTYTDRDNTLQT